jgi:peptidoglycan/xylan/chitin deacetylase (PgdA/CDA1 family)
LFGATATHTVGNGLDRRVVGFSREEAGGCVRPWIPLVASLKACAVALAFLHHPLAALVAFFAPDPWLFMQFMRPRSQAFGPAVTRFATQRREVWLTIDDGPDPGSTPAVLDLLRRHGARATFFLVGERVRSHPELARRIAAQGHGIGNHSQSHPSWSFWCALPRRTAGEIDGCVAALLLADAPFQRLFRPPVGVRNPFLEPQLAARATRMVLWSARGFDGGRRRPAAALRAIARHISPGAILLAHEGGCGAARRLEFLSLLLEGLGRDGYSCVIPEDRDLLC